MATLVLGAAGAAIGGSIGGAILGVSAATIGGFIGSTIGSVVDSWIISSLAPTQRIEGARMDNLRITSATEGAVIPRLYGRMRVAVEKENVDRAGLHEGDQTIELCSQFRKDVKEHMI